MSQYPDAHFVKSANSPSQFVPDDGTEVAVAGRSNAGKSSAINALLARKGLAPKSIFDGLYRFYKIVTFI